MATPKPRRGRRIARLGTGNSDDDLRKRCPVCDAGPGWRCTREVGYQTVPRKTVHPERKVGSDER